MKRLFAALTFALVAMLSLPAFSAGHDGWVKADVPHAAVDQAVQTPLAAVAGDEASSCNASAGCAVNVAAFDGYGGCNDRHATALPTNCYGHAAAGSGDDDDEAEHRPGART